MEDILSVAEELLGPAVRVETHRGWATFWCPFHGDKDRAGNGGKPNFGDNLQEGYWKCLRCGESGGSLNALRQKLGVEGKAPTAEPLPAQATLPCPDAGRGHGRSAGRALAFPHEVVPGTARRAALHGPGVRITYLSLGDGITG